MRSFLCALLVVAGACGGGGGNVGEPDGGDLDGAPDASVDDSDQLFQPEHVLQVSIALDPADWATLRDQSGVSAPNDTCGSQPHAQPYTDFHADLTIDGTTWSDVALRKKGGFGSISSERPGLKVNVAAYDAAQRIHGLNHLTLNNNKQDPSLISQCLGYELFRQAGIPAPRCSYAHVYVNGEDLGVYSNVETIKDTFLRRNFGDDTGRLYESGGDFAPGATAGFQPKDDPPDCTDLDPVVTALAAPDDQLAAQVGAVVDLDEFMRYWALEVVTDHWDGYANNRNNYYFYDDAVTHKIQFIPWGIDALFTERQRTTRPDSVFACGAMAWRLYDAPATRAQYLAALRDVLANVWDAPALLAEIDRMEALLTPYVDAASGWAAQLDATRAFVQGRAAALLAELDAGDPVWPYAAGDPSCRIVIGNVNASFATTWDNLGTFPAGSGSMGGTVAGTDLTSSTLFATSGPGDGGAPTMQLLAPLPDGRYAVVYIVVQDAANMTPGTRDIDLANVASFMTFYDPATDTASGGGLVLPGTLTLDQASTVSGQPVSGSVSGEVMEL
jgi:hypothetical protein